MKFYTIIFLFFFPLFLNAQNKRLETKAGEMEFGFRNTVSLFSHEATTGVGVGSQFRLRLGKQLNTEWFADLLKNNIDNLGSRTDSHIGWSVMFYPFSKESSVMPYFIAGHCFDYTKVEVFSTSLDNYYKEDRWSSAVQMGIGNSFYLNKRFNASVSAQYMLHLGGDIHSHIDTHNGIKELHVSKEKGAGAEGHLLITFSINYLIADLW